jgi:ribonuclease HII
MLLDSIDFFEKINRAKGFKFIAGIDEVGRGPLAGPVCSAAVVLPYPVPSELLQNVADSKTLTSEKREYLYKLVYKYALDIGIGIVSENEIDQINILEATKISMIKAVRKMKRVVPDKLLIDGNFKIDINIEQQSIVKGDSKSVSIASASIIAKVYRDSLMEIYHNKYPQYDFIKNKGYGTAKHCNVIKQIGPSPIHRKSFNRVKQYVVV